VSNKASWSKSAIHRLFKEHQVASNWTMYY